MCCSAGFPHPYGRMRGDQQGQYGHLLSERSQRRMRESVPAVRQYRPSGVGTTAVTAPSWAWQCWAGLFWPTMPSSGWSLLFIKAPLPHATGV